MKREEILSGLRRHHRMHLSIDPTCSHAPDCAGCIIFDNARSALTRESAPTARPNPAVSRGTPASPLNEPFNTPMIGKRNVVATHRVAPEPAPCPHRELLQSCSVILNQFAPREKVNDPWGRQSDARVETLRDRVDAALAQPCAAPGEAGDGWELVGDHAVENLTALASMGACWQPGDRVIVYRRRAPEPHPAPQPSSELPDPCATCGHDAMGHEGPWLREPPHRGQCWEKGCPCTVYRRAPEREGGDPDVR